jgi:hypothetical protein
MYTVSDNKSKVTPKNIATPGERIRTRFPLARQSMLLGVGKRLLRFYVTQNRSNALVFWFRDIARWRSDRLNCIIVLRVSMEYFNTSNIRKL